MRNKYEPLNLYSNFKASAALFPEVPIYFDEPLVAFPEFGLETTYRAAKDAIVKKASLLKEAGLTEGDKVIIYKSPKFDTYLLAVAASYIGAVPAMISYHLPVETMNVLAERLEFPFVLFDEETASKAALTANIPSAKLIQAEVLAKKRTCSISRASQTSA
ncbi:long-chain acyl-CoA synthetase [Listeria floridensis FSL S10-1187]|uniref:Long-chain acyl-CoA synthetase n=1 Tax=Listeria floridensis FSL S10-1187 TaxID=1265817 RepID=A0ABN0RIG4_9LIST|nr:long-chain acyl-CoA synthetase [Listeria floridensis FSL S10-1187]